MDHPETQAVFLALADPTRRWLIERLTTMETATASNIADQLPITRQAISKHFGVLVEAGLADCRQVGRERQYSLVPEQLDAAAGWIESVAQQWDQRLKKLEQFLSVEGENDDSSL